MSFLCNKCHLNIRVKLNRIKIKLTPSIISFIICRSKQRYIGGRGTLLVAQLVEALLYKQEGRGFDSR